MVATRKSLPNVDVNNIDVDDESIPKELRSLYVSGKETLFGEARQERRGQIYHWRGAVYEVDAKTRPEWVAAEADRWAQKEASQQPAQQTEQPGQKRKRKSASALDSRSAAQDADDADDTIEVSTDAEARMKKRARRSFPNLNVRPEKRNSTTTSPKRSQRSRSTLSPVAPASFASALRTSEHLPTAQQELQDESDGYDEDYPFKAPLDPEAALEGLEEDREKARGSGYAQEMLQLTDMKKQPPPVLSKEDMIGIALYNAVKKLGKVNSKVGKLMPIYEKMKGIGPGSGIAKKSKKGSTPRRSLERRLTPPEDEEQVTFGDENAEADDGIDELSADFMDQMQQYSQQADRDEEEQQRQLESQLQGNGQDDDNDEEVDEEEDKDEQIEQDQFAIHEDHQTTFELDETHDPETATDSSGSQQKRYRWDSATGFATNGDSPEAPATASSQTTPEVGAGEDEDEDSDARQIFTSPPPTKNTKRTTISPQVHINNKRDPFPSHPAHNRAGKRLRWSMDSFGFVPVDEEGQTQEKATRPTMTERLHNEERAESSIFRGRKEGESHQARRRRIKRELAMMKSWPVVTIVE